MSKADQLRMIREANWHARQKGVVQTPAEKQERAEKALAEALAPPKPVTDFCGHQGIGGKTCTRQAGHTEKNHRYK